MTILAKFLKSVRPKRRARIDRARSEFERRMAEVDLMIDDGIRDIIRREKLADPRRRQPHA